MYVSRLLFQTIPGKTGEVEKELKKLREMVKRAGGEGARVLIEHSDSRYFWRPLRAAFAIAGGE